jgi:hypothetical protein
MSARRADRFFGSLVADAADNNVLTTFAVLLQNEIRMVRYLAHLHNETEDVRIVIEKDALSDVRLEFPSAIIHNTASKIVFFLAEKLAINVDLFGRQFHSGRVITLDTTKHEPICEDSELAESFFARPLIAILLDWVQ